MSKSPAGLNFVSLGDKPTMEEPLNLLPIQAEVPFPDGQLLRLTATPKGLSITARPEALRDPTVLGKRLHSSSGGNLEKVAKHVSLIGGGPSSAVPSPPPSPNRSTPHSTEGARLEVSVSVPEPKSKRCISKRKVT